MAPHPGSNTKRFSESSALEVLNFYAGTFGNIRYLPAKDELIVKGLTFREELLLKDCLVALGAAAKAFVVTNSDDGVIVLREARLVAKKLSEEEINYVGRASLPSGMRRE